MSVDVTGNIIIIANVQQAKRELTELEKKQRELAKAQKEAEERAKKTAEAYSTFGKALMVAGAAGTAFIAKSTVLAARVQTLKVVVDTLGKTAGYTSSQMDDFTQSVVDQGITLRHARTAIAMMVQANVDLAKSSDLARLAQDAAVIANLNSSETFQRLIAVIQTGNIRMARHLGLVVDFQGAYERFAKANGTTAQALDQTQKVQLRVNEVMRAGAAITGAYESAMETAGKKALSLERHWEESVRIIGEGYLPSYAKIIDSVTEFLEGIEALNPAQATQVSNTIASASAFSVAAGAAAVMPKIIQGITAALGGMSASMALATGGISILVGLLAAWAVNAKLVADQEEAARKNIDDLTKQMIEEEATLHDINRARQQMAEELGLEAAKRELVTYTMYGQEFAVEQLTDGYRDLTQEELDAAQHMIELVKTTEGADRAMLQLAGVLSTELSPEIQALLDDTEDLGEEFVHTWEKSIPDPAAMIQGILEYQRYLDSEIPNIVAKIAELDSAIYDEMTITPEEGKPIFEELTKALAAEMLLMGSTVSETADMISKTLGVELWVARGYANDVYNQLQEMDGMNVTVNILQRVTRLMNQVTSQWTTPMENYQTAQQANLTPSTTYTAPASGGGGSPAEFAEGGRLTGGVNLVGERGPELIIGGRVFDTATTMALLSTGLFGNANKFGIIEDTGGGGGYTPPPLDPEDTGGAASLGGYIPPTSSGGGGGGGGSTSSTTTTTAAESTTTTEAAAEVVEKTVSPALSAVAAAVPSATDIAAGIQEAQLAQVQEQMRQNAEILNELREQTDILADQGTSNDIGRAVRDALQGIV